jgi:proteasome beta subunit
MEHIERGFKTGTTTVGIVAGNAVVLAADQRATMGHIASEDDFKKVYKISDTIGATIAGSVGDAITLIRFLRSQAKLYEIEREAPISVKALTTFMSNILHGNRYYPFITQFILGGYNSEPELYSLAPYGDIIQKKDYTVTGSGTEFALSALDSGYKNGMSTQEAIDLAIKAVKAAKRRDIYSGGMAVNVLVITKSGIQEQVIEEKRA